MKHTAYLALIVALALAVIPFSFAQWREQPTTGSVPERVPDRTTLVGLSGTGPQLEAEFINEKENREQRRVVVRVETWGVDLISPDSGLPPRSTEAFLVYRLDAGELVRSSEKEHTFSNLPSGYHSVSVQLAAADGTLVGARKVLSLHIP